MFTLPAAATLAGVGSVASQLTTTIFGDEVSAGADAFKKLYQGQLPSSAATLYTVPASTIALVKSIHVVNNDSAVRTAQFFVDGLVAANAVTPAVSIPIGGWVVYIEDGWHVYDSNGSLATTGPFDATVPTTSQPGDVAATGSAVTVARRDQVHGRESFAQSFYDPPTDQAVVANATAEFETDPIILDSGRLMTLPSGALVWSDAPRMPAMPYGKRITNEAVNVKDYGAVGDGSNDDTAAIQRAMDSGLMVFMPAGTYKITASLSINGGFRGIQGVMGRNDGAIIQPSAQTFAAFINNPNVFTNRWRIEDISVDYGIATGNVMATNPLAGAFYFTGTTCPSMFDLVRIYVIYAYYAYYDTSGSNLVTLTNCWANVCNTGFLKANSVLFNFTNCWALSCHQGFNMNGLHNSVFNACVVQSCDGVASGAIVLFQNCHGLTINGFDYESNLVTTNNASMFTLSACFAFSCNGMKGVGNTFSAAGLTQMIVYLNSGSVGAFNGCAFGSDFTDTATGAAGTVYTVLTDASAVVVQFAGCDIKAPTVGAGAPTVWAIWLSVFASQSVSLANCLSVPAATISDTGNQLDQLPDLNGHNLSNGGIMPSMYIATASADFTGTNVTTAQPVFNTTEDTITLPASRSYEFEGIYHIHTTGTASHTFGVLFAGTATLTDIGYAASVTNAATEVLGAEQTLWCTAATVQILTAATATATHHTVRLKGIVRINAAGTFIPQYQWGTTAPGVAGVTLKDSYFRMWPLGLNTTKAVGPWS